MSEIKKMHNIAMGLIFLYAVVGAALVLITALEPDQVEAVHFTFKEYIEDMVIAIAGLSIGRGILAHGKGIAKP